MKLFNFFKKRNNDQLELEKLAYLATIHGIQRASVDIMIEALSLDKEQSRVMHEKFNILFEAYSETMFKDTMSRMQKASTNPHEKSIL